MAKSLGGSLSADDLIFAQIHEIICEEYRFLHFHFSLSASNVLFNCSGSYCVVKKFSLSKIVLVSLVIFAEVYLKAVSIACSF